MMSCQEVKLRLEKLLLWISAAEFPPDDNNLKFSLWTSAVSNCLLLWFNK